MPRPVCCRKDSISRVEAVNPTLNAVVTPMFDRALDQAPSAAGPFAGVPMLLKDLIAEVEGTRFTEGSRFLASNMSTRSSELVLRFGSSARVLFGDVSCRFMLPGGDRRRRSTGTGVLFGRNR